MPRKLWLLSTVTLIVVCVAGGGLAFYRADDDPANLPGHFQAQEGWSQPFANPVLKAGDLRHQALWDDPCVLKEDGRYVMYMTTSINEPFKPPIVPFRAVSPDGVHWKLDPETPVALPDGTTFASVETPSVVKFHDQYHMFFTGIYKSGPALMAIGHAVSPDGVHWQVSPNAVISATGHPTDWNGVLVGEPGAIVHDNEMFVYFSAVGARGGGKPPQEQTIGLAKTSDGEHFSRSLKVLAQSPLYPAADGFAGYSTPAAFELDGRIHLLYDVVLSRPETHPEWQQMALHHAVSNTGGQGGFVQDDKPIMTRYEMPWTSGEVLAPTALVEDGQVKMWFAGHVAVSALGPLIRRDFAGPEFGIGYAIRSSKFFR